MWIFAGSLGKSVGLRSIFSASFMLSTNVIGVAAGSISSGSMLSTRLVFESSYKNGILTHGATASLWSGTISSACFIASPTVIVATAVGSISSDLMLSTRSVFKNSHKNGSLTHRAAASIWSGTISSACFIMSPTVIVATGGLFV